MISACCTAKRKEGTVKGTTSTRVISLLLLAACGALCQNSPSADKALQPDGSTLPEAQSTETRSWQSLPDAPMPVQPQPPTEGTVAVTMKANEPANLAPPLETSFATAYSLRFTQNQTNDAFTKYLNFQLPKPDQGYAPSASGNFLGRATYAASSTFITRTASGRPRLNTAYFVGMLALAAVHTAYRPYWERTGGAVGGDFGVSIGSNAGINVFHEFAPAIRQKTRSITPKFVYRLEERFTGGQAPSNPAPGR
jgi:hypothetical protein